MQGLVDLGFRVCGHIYIYVSVYIYIYMYIHSYIPSPQNKMSHNTLLGWEYLVLGGVQYWGKGVSFFGSNLRLSVLLLLVFQCGTRYEHETFRAWPKQSKIPASFGWCFLCTIHLNPKP